MKRILALLLSLLMTLTLLAGCTGSDQSSESSAASESEPPIAICPTEPDVEEPSGFEYSGDPVSILNLSAAPLPEFDGEQYADELETVRNAINAFSFRLSTQLANREGGNMVCSPLSVYFTLAAVLNGTEGEKQTELLDAMGLSGMTLEQVNQALATILGALTAPIAEDTDTEGHQTLQIANAVFINRDYTLKSEYAQRILDFLRGETFSVDFSSPDAVNAINQWCDQHTQGLIPEIVQQLDASTVAAVANAIYFSDRWKVEFDPEMNTEMTFRSSTGDQTATFMNRTSFFRYSEDETMQAVEIPFLTGGGLIVLLPADDTDPSELLSSMDANSFSALMDGLAPREGTLHMPKFKLDFEAGLNDALSALGLGSILDSASPMFTNMVEGENLYVTSALQKATMDVSETGTTAAAVTIMIMEATGAMEPSSAPFEMTCDHPFAVILYDNGGNWMPQILFTGTVNRIGE